MIFGIFFIIITSLFEIPKTVQVSFPFNQMCSPVLNSNSLCIMFSQFSLILLVFTHFILYLSHFTCNLCFILFLLAFYSFLLNLFWVVLVLSRIFLSFPIVILVSSKSAFKCRKKTIHPYPHYPIHHIIYPVIPYTWSVLLSLPPVINPRALSANRVDFWLFSLINFLMLPPSNISSCTLDWWRDAVLQKCCCFITFRFTPPPPVYSNVLQPHCFEWWWWAMELFLVEQHRDQRDWRRHDGNYWCWLVGLVGMTAIIDGHWWEGCNIL